jgi:4-hydroxy 2-oxovalerate aldolase
MDVNGFLMLSHMAPEDELARQAKLMESYGAHCVYVTDSGGPLTMNDVCGRVRAYRDVIEPVTEIGIHAHENCRGQGDMIVAIALTMTSRR